MHIKLKDFHLFVVVVKEKILRNKIKSDNEQ